ncbi:hypothetical protein [Bartonella koehlerae]|uniref:hypothetical protein n=1 Tax=Bartonella koehlerae TaxID=92181 RepID=UPI000553A45D|nr:hypothetical protein [Bartonella koehlerae]
MNYATSFTTPIAQGLQQTLISKEKTAASLKKDIVKRITRQSINSSISKNLKLHGKSLRTTHIFCKEECSL